jgi:hypothetical protein
MIGVYDAVPDCATSCTKHVDPGEYRHARRDLDFAKYLNSNIMLFSVAVFGRDPDPGQYPRASIRRQKPGMPDERMKG